MSLKDIAQQLLVVFDQGFFLNGKGESVDLRAGIDRAVAGTRTFTPNELQGMIPTGETTEPSQVSAEVTGETTQVAAHRLIVEEGVSDLVLLNFASARNPGGGFIKGTKAQEEDLARCSALYPCLVTQKSAYYDPNRNQKSLVYTDRMIYSPAVPFFKVRSTGDYLDKSFEASVITAPAPNAAALSRGVDPLEFDQALVRRAGMVLAVAAEYGHRNLLLGAWGCGVFRNDPRKVSAAFADQLAKPKFADAFDRVVFAIYDRSKTGNTLKAFEEQFNHADG